MSMRICLTSGISTAKVRRVMSVGFGGAWRATALQESERFKYYLDARKDAERHGFSGTALFGNPEAKASPA